MKNCFEDLKYKLLKNAWIPIIHYSFKFDTVVGNHFYLNGFQFIVYLCRGVFRILFQSD